MRSSILAALALATTTGRRAAAYPTGGDNTTITPSCKYLPGDEGWPSPDAWARLNETVGGRLVATVPLGAACHGDSYDEAECARLKDAWLYSEVQ